MDLELFPLHLLMSQVRRCQRAELGPQITIFLDLKLFFMNLVQLHKIEMPPCAKYNPSEEVPCCSLGLMTVAQGRLEGIGGEKEPRAWMTHRLDLQPPRSISFWAPGLASTRRSPGGRQACLVLGTELWKMALPAISDLPQPIREEGVRSG